MLVYPTGIPTGSTGYTIENSIWLDGSADSLNKTFGSSGNRNTYTRSFWVKRAKLGVQQKIFDTGPDGGNNTEALDFDSSDRLQWVINDSNATKYNYVTTQVFRDTTAWYHIVCARDTATLKMYVNGVEITDFSTSTNTGASNVGRWTHTDQNVIGKYFLNASTFLSAYLAEVVQIDGQILTPTSFGEFNDEGVWVPVNPSQLTFGTNGFYLNFKVAPGTGNGAGTDVSGNGNHFTDVSMTTAQQVTDTCTDNASSNIGNYATWNPLTLSGGTLSEGNTKFSASGASQGCLATIAASSGKYFCEAVMDRLNNGTVFFGVKPTSASLMTTATAASPWNQQQNLYFSYLSLDNLGGNIIDPQTASAISDNSSKYTVADGSTVGCLLDLDNYQVRWYKLDSGSWVQITNSTAAASTVGLFPADAQWTFVARGSQSGDNVTANFGHTAFSATPPESAVALNTANLPAPTVTKPDDFYNTVSFSGTGSAQNIDTVGFQPDLLIIKSRTSTANFNWIDSVRGEANILWSNAAVAQSAESTSVTGFRSAGFSVGSDSGGYVNISGQTMVAFCLRAGGSGSSNSAGTIASTVSVASHNGFSIVKYDPGSGGSAGDTVGHGMGQAPNVIISKPLENVGDTNWQYGTDAIGWTKTLFLNGTNGPATASNYWNNTAPTSTVFSLGSDRDNNAAYIAYCFARTPGLIGIGSYVGNGASDGTMVVVDDGGSGFRPAWVMIKRLEAGYAWHIQDAVRSPHNPTALGLNANDTGGDSATTGFDFIANGFNLRAGSDGGYNGSGASYIYLAFAEHPFGGDGVAQAKAR